MEQRDKGSSMMTRKMIITNVLLALAFLFTSASASAHEYEFQKSSGVKVAVLSGLELLEQFGENPDVPRTGAGAIELAEKPCPPLRKTALKAEGLKPVAGAESFGGISTNDYYKRANASGRQVAEKQGSVYVFFYIVNKAGKDVEIKAAANNEELFSQKIESEAKRPTEGNVFPPPGEYPTMELKVEVNRGAKALKVQETNSGLEASFDITNFSIKGPGFRIIIEENNISLKQDYYPVR